MTRGSSQVGHRAVTEGNPASRATVVLTCRSCVHFDDDPGRLEAEVPGILVFGSAYASSRGHAGLCSELDRFLDPRPARTCPSFEERPPIDHRDHPRDEKRVTK